MKRLAVVLALLALPMAALAQLSVTNQYGGITISGMTGTDGAGTIGASTITSSQSELTSFASFTSAKGADLGRVNFTTGTLATGSVSGGGTFADGGSFIIIGQGEWEAGLGGPKGKTTLFSGSFVGPIDWTLVSHVGQQYTYNLTGNIEGTLFNGASFTGTTSQTIYAYNGQLLQGTAHISVGTSELEKRH